MVTHNKSIDQTACLLLFELMLFCVESIAKSLLKTNRLFELCLYWPMQQHTCSFTLYTLVGWTVTTAACPFVLIDVAILFRNTLGCVVHDCYLPASLSS